MLYTSGQQLVPQNGELDLFVSGLLRAEERLDLFTISSESGIPDPSGFNLYASGQLAPEQSGMLDLFTHGKQIVTSELTSGNVFGMPLSVINNPASGENLNNSLTLNLLKPLSSGTGSDYNSFWDLIRAKPFELMLFNDHLAGNTSSSPNNNSLNLFSLGEQKLESNFRVAHAPLFVSGSGTLIATGNMPLYLQSNIVEPGSISGSVPLVIYNVHGGVLRQRWRRV